MKTDKIAARNVAKRLVCNDALVTLWSNFSDELRDMMIDAAVMDQVRLSNDEATIETGQLVAFRKRVVEALAEGVFIGKRRCGLMFERDREARRERAAYERGLAAASAQECK